MQVKEIVILTYPAVSQYVPRALECPECRQPTKQYVTALTVLDRAPLRCDYCKRSFITSFRDNRQRSVVS
ncbi:hypothetical protein [Ruminococcus sp.]|uniref:hypothetical protein n=1 Tax=Ruminococcus sp. TaxID=41978 RepID=UPI001B6471D6|nr:hypothetical protein [Ruminococcus sp.]MBP5433065.1 hypothetical protein [Ruminococcus sp.]